MYAVQNQAFYLLKNIFFFFSVPFENQEVDGECRKIDRARSTTSYEYIAYPTESVIDDRRLSKKHYVRVRILSSIVKITIYLVQLILKETTSRHGTYPPAVINNRSHSSRRRGTPPNILRECVPHVLVFINRVRENTRMHVCRLIDEIIPYVLLSEIIFVCRVIRRIRSTGGDNSNLRNLRIHVDRAP